MTLKLNRFNLPEISKNKFITVPQYDIDSVEAGIIQIGPSDFFRGHLAVYLDDLLNQGHKNCGIVAVSLNSGQERRDILSAQDNLYSVLECGKENEENIRIIGSIKKIMVGSEDPKAVISLMASPQIELVTMTITQKGYYYHPDTGLDFENPDIRESLANAEQPRATVAYIVEALNERRNAGLAPFAIMSCDNMEHNSDNLRHTVLAYAGAKSKELKNWIAHNVTFFNTMVDRIVPKLENDSVTRIENKYGFSDQWPIVTEEFKQLVVGITPETIQSLPPLNLVGADYVPNVTVYELMKLRIFNGAAHFAFALAARLEGEEYMDEALQRQDLVSLNKELMKEAGNTCPGREDKDAYIKTIFNRLVCSHDELQRIARNGSDKIFTRLLSPIRDAIAQDLPYGTLVGGVVDWVTYMQKANPDPGVEHDTKEGFYIEDRNAYEKGIVGVAKTCNGDVSPMLALTDVWNGLQHDTRFVQAFRETYARRHVSSGHGLAASI